MTDKDLSPIERAVLEKVLSGKSALLDRLRGQIAQCTVRSREFTGCGFYTEFDVSERIPRTPGLDIKAGDVVAKIPGLANGAGFLLFVKDGVLDMLEGYSFDEAWPDSIEEFSLQYVNENQRDLPERQ